MKGASTAEIARKPDSTTSSSSGGNNSGGDVTVKTPADEKTPASSSSQSPAQSSTGSGSSTPSSDTTIQSGVTAKPTPTSSTRGKFGETYPYSLADSKYFRGPWTGRLCHTDRKTSSNTQPNHFISNSI